MSDQDITALLHRWTAGEKPALDKLVPLVEQELRRMARRSLRNEREGHTFQTADLVNEAYIKMVDQTRVVWQNRAHFFAIVAQIMRRVLLDHARKQNRTKRGGDLDRVVLSDIAISSPQRPQDLIDLDEALTKLEQTDRLKSQIVEYRYFGGLSLEETAEVLQVSPITVSRHWHLAKLWLRRELTANEDG